MLQRAPRLSFYQAERPKKRAQTLHSATRKVATLSFSSLMQLSKERAQLRVCARDQPEKVSKLKLLLNSGRKLPVRPKAAELAACNESNAKQFAKHQTEWWLIMQSHYVTIQLNAIR